MNLLNRLRCQAFWLNAPTMLVILLLQRTPVVRIVSMAEQVFSSSTISVILRGTLVATSAVAVHTLAGATELSASTDSPLAAQVGTPVNVAFSITGTLSSPERWFITGSVPPGLSFGGSTGGTVISATLLLSGTPTTAGNYTIGLQAKDDPTGNVTPVYDYVVNVTNPAPVAPAITTHPQSKSAFVGDNVSFTGAASGSPTPTFKWQKDGVDIGGATTATLTLNNVQLGDAAIYTLVATNSAGTATSNGAMLTVDLPPEAPQITTQPLGTSVTVGDDVMFEVAASGNPTPAIQWKKNGADIPGETATTLLLTGVQLDDAGTYTAVATNTSGSATSNGAVLTVTALPSAPAITSQPPGYSIAVDGSVTFTVGFSGFPEPAVQWQRSTDGGANWSDLADGGVFAGTATATLRVTKVTLAMNGQRFRAVVTNSEGSATSNAGTLNVAATTGARLINLSTRASAGAGNKTLIMGFFISGTGSKTLLIRGVGPTLAGLTGLPAVVDPKLNIYNSSDQIIASSDDWDPVLATSFSAVGAFPLQDASKDAATTVTLSPGRYTIHLINDGAINDALIEVYDLSRDLGTRLTNLSCRFLMNPNETLTVGTALTGGDIPVLVRGIGPELANYGLNIADLLPDPQLRVFSGSTEVNMNDDWDESLQPFFGPVGAFPLTVGSPDAALRQTFNPGGYTVQATGKGGGGVALVELYESP